MACNFDTHSLARPQTPQNRFLTAELMNDDPLVDQGPAEASSKFNSSRHLSFSPWPSRAGHLLQTTANRRISGVGFAALLF